MIDHARQVRLASLAAFFSASIWGLYWVPLRYLYDNGVHGGWSVALVNFPAALILLGVSVYYRHGMQRFLGLAVLIGLFAGSGVALYSVGLVYTSVVRATLLFYLTPVWATLIGLAWLGEPASITRWVAIAAGLAGLVLLVSGGGSTPLNIGDVYALLSGVTWAIGAAMIMRYGDVPISLMAAAQFLFATAFGIAAGWLAGDTSPPAAAALFNALPLGVFVSVVLFLPAVCLIFWAQKILFPGRAGLLMMSEVLVAVISASILLPEERMSILQWAGAALIISACLIEVIQGQSGAARQAVE